MQAADGNYGHGAAQSPKGDDSNDEAKGPEVDDDMAPKNDSDDETAGAAGKGKGDAMAPKDDSDDEAEGPEVDDDMAPKDDSDDESAGIAGIGKSMAPKDVSDDEAEGPEVDDDMAPKDGSNDESAEGPVEGGMNADGGAHNLGPQLYPSSRGTFFVPRP